MPLLIFGVPLAFAESSNVGTIYWKQEVISSNSFVDIYVKDNDMNKKEYPNFADKFSITVWSDTSPDGLEIQVVETGVYSGIFKGSIYIADSGETSKNRLVSNLGDKLYAKYVDFTIPNGSDSEIISAAVVKIPGQNMDEILKTIDPKFRTIPTVHEKVPSWIKNNASWWAEGSIDDDSFIQGIEFLIKDNIIHVEKIVGVQTHNKIPSWVKNNAGWWADGAINESDFLNGINHLVKIGLISVSIGDEIAHDPVAECQSIKSTYKRLGCEKEIKQKIEFDNFKQISKTYSVGPATFYYPGIGNLGNDFEISSSGQPILSLRIMVENNGIENLAMMCSGPAICNYDVWDGEKAFKYSSMDFVSGQIVVKPETFYIFNMMFGPNIGYGGTTFEYDSANKYSFRISESWGNQLISLNIDDNMT